MLRVVVHLEVIYFVNCTSLSCSKTPAHHAAATCILHSWDDVLRLASFLLFPPKLTMIIMAKHFILVSSEHGKNLQKSLSLSDFASSFDVVLWCFTHQHMFISGTHNLSLS
ncbi:hypothetical protein GOODEAATRI_004096 [Goodea atripinnis]|uniref:Uncharacterized protein n=1 Tax=Goodea atripinnis TaxID=208336 RepID=A0ABV0P1J5_9TELE